MFFKLKSLIDNNTTVDFKYSPVLTISILIAFLVIWSTLYLQVHIDADASWLLQCLERFMAGGTYTHDFHETNPPLSFWIYLPCYPLYTYMNIDAKLSIFIVVIIYFIIANTTLLLLLRKHKSLTPLDLFILINAIIFTQSWVAGAAFGAKDHLIAAFLLPLILYQYRLTKELKSGALLATSAIILGGIAICLKPHYAIIPALFFIHRLYISRSILKCMMAPDFLGMLIIGVTYLLLIWFLTPEFFEILPQLAYLYGADHPYPLSVRFHYLLYAAIAAIAAPFVLSENKQKFLQRSVYILSALSLISLIPYLIQTKGFHYHALPLLCYGAAAGFIMIYGMIKELAKCKSDIALWGTYIAMIIIFGGYTWGNKIPKLTKEQFMEIPLHSAIDELAWNRVYATYMLRHHLVTLPYVSSLKNGSRFGTIWELIGISQIISKTNTPDERKIIEEQAYKTVDMIVEDMRRYKPSVITIPQDLNPETQKYEKSYFEFLMGHTSFKENMSNYTFYDTIIYDLSLAPVGRNITPEDLIPHDIYVLNRDNTL
jgi:hypothetical protein